MSVFQKLGSLTTMPSIRMLELRSILMRLIFVSFCARMALPFASMIPRPRILVLLTL